ncbi:MAG: biotin/lipoyl-containing protein [Phycisphaerae bacterium]|jgi:pyruvate/2-oxoglutarate dehydrogenase complex dihydrolipoamide acyltransferase (E2) component|nr:biotin/lipoyl-containing protein [Phycisphaerae bacterium]
MSEEIIMPQIGQDITTGTIVEWLKKEGDPVEKGEVVCNVEGDKGIFEVEAEESGVLLRILHPEGQEVEVLKPIGYIGQPGEKIDPASMG